ncbi:hypothetical protein NC653_038979 [Populus alba x Populus x berolinensis]|uniref:Uncharacterized protein n=1 Tax=Populus alba x Populus x berolinensis TaxID=444605 RepID=A0AAD6LA59_9ROSI|nr:hypothetical protein NC653_038979 [Populus alba x Populus x berolinensis]
MIGSCLLGVRMESRRWDFELKEKVLCLLLADSATLFQLELHGSTSTQPQMVESSMNTPLWSGSNGHQTSTSNLVWQFNVDGPKDFDQVVLDCLQQSSSTESIRSLEDEGLI